MEARSFGQLLRGWRNRRRFTQLALAHEAEVSPRHLSCLETGRSKPSREMVLVLASRLEVPLAERNRMLLSAGFAPAYSADGLEGKDAAAVSRALRFMLQRHWPYPATVVDPCWNLVMANDAYVRLSQWIGGANLAAADPGRIHDQPPLRGTNILIQLFDPAGLRPMVRNFDTMAPVLLDHLRHTAREDAHALAMLHRLERLGPIPTGSTPDGRLPLVVPLELDVRDTRLALFSTMTMLGTATDTVLSALRLETYFPADESTDRRINEISSDA